jgi:hypothetical protein
LHVPQGVDIGGIGQRHAHGNPAWISGGSALAVDTRHAADVAASKRKLEVGELEGDPGAGSGEEVTDLTLALPPAAIAAVPRQKTRTTPSGF